MSVLKQCIINAISNGDDPRSLLEQLEIDIDVPEDATSVQLWLLLLNFAKNLEESNSRIGYGGYNYRMLPSSREYITSIETVVDHINKAEKIVVIIGAGASVGPDFRSPGGLYETIEKSGALEDPYQVFDIDYFQKDPSVFWRFAHLIFPSLHPDHSLAHFFIAELEKRGKLQRLYSQNVDTLEIGVPDCRLQCVHGSWRHNRCLSCGEVHSMEDLRENVNTQTVPTCKNCGKVGTIKPGIVFFGQQTNISSEMIDYDSNTADLLIVIGTSLRVAPVSFIPRKMYRVPSILINREPVTCQFNAELLGDCDPIVAAIENHIGWGVPGLQEKTKIEESSSLGADEIAQEVCKSHSEDFAIHDIDEFTFIEPNKFVLPREDGMSVGFVSTGRSTFLVSPAFAGTDQFD